MPTERRLAAIMFTDIVGYTALMAESEEHALITKMIWASANSVRSLRTGEVSGGRPTIHLSES